MTIVTDRGMEKTNGDKTDAMGRFAEIVLQYGSTNGRIYDESGKLVYSWKRS